MDDDRTHSLGPEAAPADPGRSYVLVFDGATSTMVRLPTVGVLLIGRGDGVDIALDDSAVSRRHARLMLADGEARIVDLDSHNGVRVNGARIEGVRALASGDVVSIGETALVFHAAPQKIAPRALADATAVRRRLAEEIARALEAERPLGLLLMMNPPPGALEALAPKLRAADIAGALDDGRVAVVLPELPAHAIAAAAEELIEAAGGAGAGLAIAPDDGCDVDTLVASASAAAASAPRGQLRAAHEVQSELEIGDRRVVVADSAMVRVYDLLRRLSKSELPVLVCGETGSGKEHAAFSVHAWSRRASAPFLAINCAAIAENLVESELFGYEKGAFSGANAPKVGLLEAANGGTLFFDEVGELPAPAQAKLLRALEQRKILRVGGTRERDIDVRVVAATHRDLEEDARRGRFRQDLFFRLAAAVVLLPPLRERPREIGLLARRFLSDACARAERPELAIAPSTMGVLARYDWPGNVRELKNLMELLAATVTGWLVEPRHLPPRLRGAPSSLGLGAAAPEPENFSPAAPVAAVAATGAAGGDANDAQAREPRYQSLAEELRELERRRMLEALEATGGVQNRAAELIGMPIRTFAVKYKQYRLASHRR